MTPRTGLVLVPSGPLDADACAALRRSLSSALASGLSNIVLDMSEVTHLEIEAVQLLNGVRQYLNRHDGSLVVTNPSPAALRGLRTNDLTDLLSLEDLPVARPRLSSVNTG